MRLHVALLQMWLLHARGMLAASPRECNADPPPPPPRPTQPRAGKYARVGTMLAKESVRKRMESEQGISYTEFTYQLLQASASFVRPEVRTARAHGM